MAFNPFSRRTASGVQSPFAGRMQIMREGVGSVIADRSAIYFRLRSPEAQRAMIGVPPNLVISEPELQGLQPANLPQQAEQQGPFPSVSAMNAQYMPQLYGDMITFAVVFGATGQQLILPRPNTWRTSLLIMNSTVVGNIFYVFDRVADNVSCVPIVAGGNRLFDFSCPQGDLHIFSSGAGTVIIEYMNRKIDQESYR